MKLPNDLRRIAVEGKLYEKAHDDLGIYPQGRYEPDGTFIPRNEYQNGWNAAVSAHLHKVIAYHEFIDSLSKSDRIQLEELILDDAIEISKGDDNKVHLWVNVSDMFYYATADSEEVAIEEIELIHRLHFKYEYDGIVAWASKKRGEEPLHYKFSKTKKYEDALGELNGTEKGKSFIQKVLSACGL